MKFKKKPSKSCIFIYLLTDSNHFPDGLLVLDFPSKCYLVNRHSLLNVHSFKTKIAFNCFFITVRVSFKCIYIK